MEIQKIQKLVTNECKKINKLKWADQFSVGYFDTFNKTVKINNEENKVFVFTGDIPAMWLRDSTCQVLPYLLLAKTNHYFSELLGNLVRTQCQYILVDPYANAFNQEANSAGHQEDKTRMNPSVWERKFEIDSLCFPVFLAYKLYKDCQYIKHFDEIFYKTVQAIIRVFQIEQDHENSDYRFERFSARPEDTLQREGRGTSVAKTGMIWSGFRPSDDACQYGYLIPSNLFAVVILEQLEEIIEKFYHDKILVMQISKLKNEVNQGIKHFGVVNDPVSEKQIFAYEVDGFGNSLLMDDANVPSLLSAPYLGYCDHNDVIYQNTRSFILSQENPYYYEGKFAGGIGSSHTPKNYVWPISLSIQGLTATTNKEKAMILDTIVATDNGTKQCHESFDVDDPAKYTREWFSWSNMMFCQLVLDYFKMN